MAYWDTPELDNPDLTDEEMIEILDRLEEEFLRGKKTMNMHDWAFSVVEEYDREQAALAAKAATAA